MGKHSVIIDNDTCSSNIFNNPVYYQCEGTSHYLPPSYGTYGVGEPVRCGSESMYLVTYPAGSSIITKHLCNGCTEIIINKAKCLGYEIVDERNVNSPSAI